MEGCRKGVTGTQPRAVSIDVEILSQRLAEEQLEFSLTEMKFGPFAGRESSECVTYLSKTAPFEYVNMNTQYMKNRYQVSFIHCWFLCWSYNGPFSGFVQRCCLVGEKIGRKLTPRLYID